MARLQKNTNLVEEFNPFEIRDSSEALRVSLNAIDNRDIRTKFKNAEDPINYVFESFDNASLKALAKDFVKESVTDIVSFITRIMK